MKEVQLFIGGSWVDGREQVELRDKFSGAFLTSVHIASVSQVDMALDDAQEEFDRNPLPAWQRSGILHRTADLVEHRTAEFCSAVIDDTGFTQGDAEREVSRSVETLRISAEEATRIHGQMVPMERTAAGDKRLGFTVRFPRGVVCAITPFNSPLNTLVHKIGPALAAGNAAVIKPSAYTPLSARALVEVLLEAGLPPRMISLLQGPGSTVGDALLRSPVPSFYAFTGSNVVGEHIRRTIGLRPHQLELGSLSSTVICADADLDRAVQLCVDAAFRKAGQVCTSIQRLYIEESVFDDVSSRLTGIAKALKVGNPRDPETQVGPVISLDDANRINSWITSAIDLGAKPLMTGPLSGQIVEPTVLVDANSTMDVFSKEVFGPVLSLVPFRNLGSAFDEINDTPYGLSAGIFTSDIATALNAVHRLRMGSVHINQTSSSRVDSMPYGGVKASGIGLEGPRYAIEEMTEQRLVTLATP